MAETVKTIAIFTAHAGRSEVLKALLETMVEPSRAESGNLQYNLWQVQSEIGCFILEEIYVTNDAVEAHRATSHYQGYRARIDGVADRTVLILKPLNVC